MNNKEHCKATRILLGVKPHPELHAYMDYYSKELGWGHRILRHNMSMVKDAEELYGEKGRLEVIFHIACDMGLIEKKDIDWGLR